MESDKKQLVLKLATGSTAGLLAWAAFTQIMSGPHYQTQLFVCVYYTFFSAIVILTEFSPLILEDYLINFLPFLGTVRGKACFYAILGTFCFDPTFNFFGHVAGGLLFTVSALWLLYDWVYYAQPRSKVTSGFQGYYQAQQKPNFMGDSVNKSHISEYSMQQIQENQ